MQKALKHLNKTEETDFTAINQGQDPKRHKKSTG